MKDKRKDIRWPGVMEQLHEIIAPIRSRLWLFLAIYSLPMCSVVISSMIYRPHGGLAVVLAGDFVVLVGLFQTLATGRSTTNTGTVLRSENPNGFWTRVVTWAIVYILVTLWPIGYALQETHRESESTP